MRPLIRTMLLLIGMFVTAAATCASAQTPSPPGAKVYFINLKDGAELDSPFLIQFGLSGMGVAPAGIEKPNTGHHHLIIDTTLTSEELKQPIPVDDHHLHFGGGQTEAMVTLPKGQHTLQLVLGDWTHSACATRDVGRDYRYCALETGGGAGTSRASCQVA
jgi:Domain of unknown function (DUF4399)